MLFYNMSMNVKMIRCINTRNILIFSLINQRMKVLRAIISISIVWISSLLAHIIKVNEDIGLGIHKGVATRYL